MTTDTTERGLERLICIALAGHPYTPGAGDQPGLPDRRLDRGRSGDFDREYCLDLTQLAAFLRETQEETAEAVEIGRQWISETNFQLTYEPEGE